MAASHAGPVWWMFPVSLYGVSPAIGSKRMHNERTGLFRHISPHATRSCQLNAIEFSPQLHFHNQLKFRLIRALPHNVRIVAVGVSGRSTYGEKAVGRGRLAADVVRVT